MLTRRHQKLVIELTRVLAIAVALLMLTVLIITRSQAAFSDTTVNPSNSFASGYRILRSPTLGGPYTQIAELTPRTTVSYVDSAPEGIYYYVGRSFFGSWEAPTATKPPGGLAALIPICALASVSMWTWAAPTPTSPATRTPSSIPGDRRVQESAATLRWGHRLRDTKWRTAPRLT